MPIRRPPRTTILGGSGAISLNQHGTTTISAGSGTITVTADGSSLVIEGADGSGPATWTLPAGDVVTIQTDGTSRATTVTDAVFHRSRLLAGGQVVNLVDGTGGGLIPDVSGLDRITLGAAAATVTASAGTDTIIGGSGSLIINASGDANPLVIDAAATATATTVFGGSGSITLRQHGAIAISAGSGAINITSDGSPLVITGADGREVATWTVPGGDGVTIRTDAATFVTTVADPTSGRGLRLGGGQVLNVIDGSAGGPIPDAAGFDQITLGSVAATVAASLGSSDTINGGTGALTLLGGGGMILLNQHGAASITAGTGLITVMSDGSPLSVTGVDGSVMRGFAVVSGDTVTVQTDASGRVTTVVDQRSHETVRLANNQAVHVISGVGGGVVTDFTGLNQIVLGSAPATVSASLGSDTITGGSGALTVAASGNASPLVIDAGSATGTIILGGSGTISLTQHRATTITPGSGTITVTSDGGALGINGADGKELDAWPVAAGDVVTIRTNGTTLATTVIDTTTGTSRLLAGGQVINLIDGTAGGTVTDIGGPNRITLGSLAATVLASAGVDTVVGGTGRFTVDASADFNALTINAGQANGTTVKGGSGPIALAQHGIAAISAGTGTITIDADGSPLAVTGADGAESSTWSPTAGDVVTIQTDAGTRVTTVSDRAAHRTLRLGGGQALNLVDGTAGGTILDAAGSNLITLGTAAALVTASAGTDTITGGSGALTVNAAGNSHPLRIVGGSGALTVTPGAGADTVFGSASGPTRVLSGGTQGTLFYYDDGGSATITGAAQDTSITATSGSIAFTQRGDTTIHAGTGPMTVRTNGGRLAITGWGVSTVLDRSWTSGDMLLLGYNGTVTTVTDEQTGDVYDLTATGVTAVSGSLPGPQDPLAGEGSSAYVGLLGQYLSQVPGQPGAPDLLRPGLGRAVERHPEPADRERRRRDRHRADAGGDRPQPDRRDGPRGQRRGRPVHHLHHELHLPCEWRLRRRAGGRQRGRRQCREQPHRAGAGRRR